MFKFNYDRGYQYREITKRLAKAVIEKYGYDENNRYEIGRCYILKTSDVFFGYYPIIKIEILINGNTVGWALVESVHINWNDDNPFPLNEYGMFEIRTDEFNYKYMHSLVRLNDRILFLKDDPKNPLYLPTDPGLIEKTIFKEELDKLIKEIQ